ncbi:hypothetical protein D9M71_603030 [compost metagenome]
MVATEGVLQGVQLFPLREAFHRFDRTPLGLHGKCQARAHGRPVDQDRATAAYSLLAADLCSRQAHHLTQGIGQMHTSLDMKHAGLAVYGGGYAHQLAFFMRLHTWLLALPSR